MMSREILQPETFIVLLTEWDTSEPNTPSYTTRLEFHRLAVALDHAHAYAATDDRHHARRWAAVWFGEALCLWSNADDHHAATHFDGPAAPGRYLYEDAEELDGPPCWRLQYVDNPDETRSDTPPLNIHCGISQNENPR